MVRQPYWLFDLLASGKFFPLVLREIFPSCTFSMMVLLFPYRHSQTTNGLATPQQSKKKNQKENI